MAISQTGQKIKNILSPFLTDTTRQADEGDCPAEIGVGFDLGSSSVSLTQREEVETVTWGVPTT